MGAATLCGCRCRASGEATAEAGTPPAARAGPIRSLRKFENSEPNIAAPNELPMVRKNVTPEVATPPPRQVVGEVAPQQRTDDSRDTEHRAQDALVAAPFPQRDDLTDQRAGGDGDCAAADPLQRARSHQHGHRLG